MGDVAKQLAEIVGQRSLLADDAIPEDYTHDEGLAATPQKPGYVAKPAK
jgi:glycolate oxidase